eukprot:203074-Hanusia_phi.AAC.1
MMKPAGNLCWQTFKHPPQASRAIIVDVFMGPEERRGLGTRMDMGHYCLLAAVYKEGEGDEAPGTER